MIKTLKYNLNEFLYRKLENQGIAYNVSLFIKKFSKRAKTGTLTLSYKRFPNSIKFVKENNMTFWNYYIPETPIISFRGISLHPLITNAKVIYLKVNPTKRKTNN